LTRQSRIIPLANSPNCTLDLEQLCFDLEALMLASDALPTEQIEQIVDPELPVGC
jgi:hypothetical protein